MTILELPDGHFLDVDASGPAAGVPMIFHYGTPGSVRQFRATRRAAHDRGLRLVTYSRAGYGASTRRPGRRVVDVAADVAAILANLGASRCLVAGWSGGGGHALATGARLPEQVAGVLVIAGVAPYDAADLDFLDGMGAALRSGVDGWVDDDLAFLAPWGFALAEIAVPTFVWQGSKDLMVPFAHGQWLAAHVPGAVAHLEQGEGHLSIGVGALERMLDELVTTLSG